MFAYWIIKVTTGISEMYLGPCQGDGAFFAKITFLAKKTSSVVNTALSCQAAISWKFGLSSFLRDYLDPRYGKHYL